MLRRTHSFFRQVLHAVLPVTCVRCGENLWDDPVPFFCRQCWSSIRPISGPICPRCSRPFSSSISLLHSPSHRCIDCRKHPPAYSRALTPYAYQTPLKEAISLFKYHGRVSLAGHLANLMSAELDLFRDMDLILPVPLHPSRLREREYNQSLLLADRLSRRLNIPLSHTSLVRTQATPPQTSLKRKDRLKNLRKSFAVTQPNLVAGKRVLLIDDVLTTGTTVNECAKALRKADCQDVYVATLARML